ncbi:PadR family transcriptional regulator [Porphyrobacter sp. CACIAM 03H1]|jgi:DNA-binding PadR family transcriptional regulator|uniref:PadR family transcriptional regulator n=1 Tax=Porphyrobacter sp. CACIAM 03H1 TaxID=2003315 RepID=UPI000B5A33C8|nr:helix-turn-helix transcriptional regulator [Porphyrobacter sp. CACIAM 03H1]ASJ90674.1 transcriptional regulator [Porphyrobacter sp. CACIAM 03H1]
MTWNRYGRGGGWEKFAETMAMMAMNGNMNFGGPGWKMRARFDEEFPRGREREGDGEGEERGRRGRRGRMFAQGELRLALLALIAETPRHGYELIKEIEEMTGGAYAPSPGAVYPTLQLLEDEGAIEEAEAEGAKKPFAATQQGRDELESRQDEVETLMRRLGRHGERTTTVRSHDLFRAMGNLGSVLKNRARAGKLDEHTINEIVDMIDEMAKRIERL